MLQGMTNEQDHCLDVIDDIAEKNKLFINVLGVVRIVALSISSHLQTQ